MKGDIFIFFFKSFVLFSIGGQLLYNIVMVSDIHQHESAVCCAVLSHFSRVQFCGPTDCTHQAPLSLRFSRQDYWSGLPCPLPWNLPHPGIEPTSLGVPSLAGEFFTTSTTWEAHESATDMSFDGNPVLIVVTVLCI